MIIRSSRLAGTGLRGFLHRLLFFCLWPVFAVLLAGGMVVGGVLIWPWLLFARTYRRVPKPAQSTALELAEKERDHLRAFKAYVHRRLDEEGVPADPDPEHTIEHGCRIEGRLEWCFDRMAR